MLSVWYRTQADQDYLPDRGPVMVVSDGVTKLLAGTTDKAGNDEPKPLLVEVKIDTKAPETTATMQGASDKGVYTGAVQVSIAGSGGTERPEGRSVSA